MTPADLPSVDDDYPVGDDVLALFRRDGHVKLEGVFSRDEVAAYRPALKGAVERSNTDHQSMEQKVAGNNKNWMFVNNLWLLDPAARRFVLSPRLGRIAADLMGVDAVRLFRDQSYFKRAGGANTPWHQDAYFMPLDTDQILTMWIPLTDIVPELAPMSYVTGSHRHGFIGPSVGDDAAMDRFEADMRARGFGIHNYGTLNAGDVAVHSAWTMHGSRSNTSDKLREAVVIVFFADGARVAAERPVAAGAPPQESFARVIRRQNRDTSLPGLRPGDLAAGPMTPLVFSRGA